ncbi:hypothetical protein AVEN_73061-1 [Araneus ventricosus]|uniref:Uncharacterized protein n=1 Tax=Araneus ventricosus TaxID=182803 RepID=A0A4Y2UU45_ARAVE|nr:hypothetical protein AVEN_73061-1 [Araneus ventricosus]
MAAAKSDQREEIERTVYRGPDWHGFVYDFTLLNLGAKESCTFRQVFETKCESWPSSWSCEMQFQKVSDDGTVSIPVSLRRTDSIGSIVDVRTVLRLRDLNDRRLFFSWTTEKERNRCGVVIEETLVESIPLQKDRSDFNRTLRINLFIYVLFCHSPPFNTKSKKRP